MIICKFFFTEYLLSTIYININLIFKNRMYIIVCRNVEKFCKTIKVSKLYD